MRPASPYRLMRCQLFDDRIPPGMRDMLSRPCAPAPHSTVNEASVDASGVCGLPTLPIGPARVHIRITGSAGCRHQKSALKRSSSGKRERAHKCTEQRGGGDAVQGAHLLALLHHLRA
jgi:hypothetical protein